MSSMQADASTMKNRPFEKYTQVQKVKYLTKALQNTLPIELQLRGPLDKLGPVKKKVKVLEQVDAHLTSLINTVTGSKHALEVSVDKLPSEVRPMAQATLLMKRLQRVLGIDCNPLLCKSDVTLEIALARIREYQSRIDAVKARSTSRSKALAKSSTRPSVRVTRAAVMRRSLIRRKGYVPYDHDAAATIQQAPDALLRPPTLESLQAAVPIRGEQATLEMWAWIGERMEPHPRSEIAAMTNTAGRTSTTTSTSASTSDSMDSVEAFFRDAVSSSSSSSGRDADAVTIDSTAAAAPIAQSSQGQDLTREATPMDVDAPPNVLGPQNGQFRSAAPSTPSSMRRTSDTSTACELTHESQTNHYAHAYKFPPMPTQAQPMVRIPILSRGQIPQRNNNSSTWMDMNMHQYRYRQRQPLQLHYRYGNGGAFAALPVPVPPQSQPQMRYIPVPVCVKAPPPLQYSGVQMLTCPTLYNSTPASVPAPALSTAYSPPETHVVYNPDSNDGPGCSLPPMDYVLACEAQGRAYRCYRLAQELSRDPAAPAPALTTAYSPPETHVVYNPDSNDGPGRSLPPMDYVPACEAQGRMCRYHRLAQEISRNLRREGEGWM